MLISLIKISILPLIRVLSSQPLTNRVNFFTTQKRHPSDYRYLRSHTQAIKLSNLLLYLFQFKAKLHYYSIGQV